MCSDIIEDYQSQFIQIWIDEKMLTLGLGEIWRAAILPLLTNLQYIFSKSITSLCHLGVPLRQEIGRISKIIDEKVMIKHWDKIIYFLRVGAYNDNIINVDQDKQLEVIPME